MLDRRIVKISAQNIQVFKSYLNIKGQKVGVWVTRISPPNLLIQNSGWYQNVANTCRYNLTEPDFSKFCFFTCGESFSQKVRKIRGTPTGKNSVFSRSKSKMKNPALLSCRAEFLLHFKILPSFLACKMAEKSFTHQHEKAEKSVPEKRIQVLTSKIQYFSSSCGIGKN